MSDYDYRPSHQRGAGAMDYSGGSGGSIWTVIGLLAVLALIGLILFGAATGTPEGSETAPTVPAPAAGDTG